MKLKNCVECGQIMRASLRDVCPECLEKKEKIFLKVRDFIKDNPKVSIEVVVEATTATEQQIRQFMREGLIESADLDCPPLTCQRCGKPIAVGLYCTLCHQEFSSGQTLGSNKGKDPKSRKEKKHSRIIEYRKRK